MINYVSIYQLYVFFLYLCPELATYAALVVAEVAVDENRNNTFILNIILLKTNLKQRMDRKNNREEQDI